MYIFFICKFNVHQECIWNVLNGVLGGEGEKAKMRGREGIVGVKTDLTRPYLYLGHLQLINYSIYLFFD